MEQALPSFIRSLAMERGDPYASLIIAGNTLYGTLTPGNVFAINTDGTGYTVLHSFVVGQMGVPRIQP